MRCILVISFFSSVSMSFAQEWLTLTPDPSYTSFNNAQCIEAVGNFIHVVYTEGVESKEQVYYTRSNSNFYYWETNKVISGTRKGAYPSISVSGDIVHVVFVEPWYGGGIYYTRSDDNGDSWEDPVLLTSTHAEIAFPSLAVSGQTLHLVWQDRREISSEIYYKKSEDGGHTWTDDRKLTNTEQESISPCVAVDSSNVHLVWKDDDGVHYQQSVDGGNTWAGDVLLAWLGDQPTITVSGNLVMVLWADNRDGSADIYLRRSLDSGHVWEDEIQPVAHINPASSPRVASSGNFCYLVWNEMVDHTWSILTSFSTNGGLTWYYPERSNISSGFAIRPFVAIHDKDVHIICTEKDLLNGNQEIRYAHEKNVFPDFSHNSFEWGFGYVSTSDECGQALITDDAGNVYVTGYFSKTIDFDPGPGVYNMMSVGGGYDIFIEKFNASGQLMWAHRAGNSFHDAANAVTLDAHGNVFVAGYFSGKVDFDPGPSVYELQSAGVQDIFILKLDPGGNFIWARRMGGSGTDIANSIAIDSSGRIITVGSFSEVADFNPGTGINNLTSNGMVDIFISVLDRNGLFVDAQSFGGPEYDYASAVITDTSNSIFVTGTFGDTIDFDFGTDIHMLSSNGKNDIFLLKLNAAGKWEWSKSVGSAGNDNSSAMVIDRDGNIYMCGSFSKEMDIDPGPGVVWLDLYGGIFILKLDADGQYEWSTAFGGFGNASGIALDDFHNVYVTGGFQYLNIGRSFQNQYLESFESDDVFTLKVNPKGVLVWIDVMSGLSYAEGCGIAIYSNTDIYVTGQYYESLDLDPSIDLHLLESPAGSYRDFFIIKTRQCAPVYNTITATACEFYWAPDGYTHWTTSGTYQEVLLTNEGCDSVLTVNLTILNPTSGEEVITACDQYISPKGNIWNASGVYHETLTNGAGCDSIVTYYLTINQHS
ncbi:MAG: hypothetical protein ABJB16_07590, partial [Saprospiraceae bacterium]